MSRHHPSTCCVTGEATWPREWPLGLSPQHLRQRLINGCENSVLLAFHGQVPYAMAISLRMSLVGVPGGQLTAPHSAGSVPPHFFPLQIRESHTIVVLMGGPTR